MRILVTGGEGFTGRYVRHELERGGHEVTDLRARLEDAAAMRDEVSRIAPDAVIHLAAVAFVAHSEARAFYDVNLVGTMNLLDALASHAEAGGTLRRVVLASSANVYGPGEGTALTEETPANPSNHYALSKFAMERMSALYRDRLPTVIVRPFNYTGPGQDENFVVPKIVAAFRRGDRSIRLGRTDVRRDFSDVRAVTAAYRGLVEADRLPADTFNVCSGRARSIDEVIDICAEAAGYRMEIERDPAFMRRGDIETLVGSNARLRGTLPSWEPIGFERTLRDMLAA